MSGHGAAAVRLDRLSWRLLWAVALGAAMGGRQCWAANVRYRWYAWAGRQAGLKG